MFDVLPLHAELYLFNRLCDLVAFQTPDRHQAIVPRDAL